MLTQEGRDAVSTRAVSAAAGVQPPTIYRQFGDMQGLLNAVAFEVFDEHVREKTSGILDDPIEEARRRWDLHVAFGVANPTVYMLIHGDLPATDKPVTQAADAHLEEMLLHLAKAGRLRMSIPQAKRLISAAVDGVTLSLIATPPETRDMKLSTMMREAVIGAITISPASESGNHEGSGPERLAARAIALRAVLAEATAEGIDVLSPAELHLLGEWLDRLASTSG